jgi:hypothetical protein
VEIEPLVVAILGLRAKIIWKNLGRAASSNALGFLLSKNQSFTGKIYSSGGWKIKRYLIWQY